MTEHKMKPIIGFFGIGLMGKPMAINLVKAGYDVLVWNRTGAKAAELIAYGARHAQELKEAACADILITMLEAGPQVQLVIEAMLNEIRPGTLVIDMSSTRQSEAQEIHALLKEKNIHFLDAPVSGGVVGAEAASLAIMAGGDADQFERAKPILSAMGKPTLVGDAGCGQLSKLCNQLIVGATLNIIAEALLLAEAGGADPAAVRASIRGGFAESRLLEVHGQRMLDRNFMPGGQVKTQLKDLENILDAAKNSGVNLSVTALVTEHYRALAKITPHADQSAILLGVEKENSGHRVGKAVDKLPA